MGGPPHDLCKPCQNDSQCTDGTVCSIPRLFPDSPIDRYCIPSSQLSFSCLSSTEAFDHPVTVGLPGIDTPHHLITTSQDGYLSCASTCFKKDQTDGFEYPVSIYLKKQPDGLLKKQTDLFGLSAEEKNCLCLGMADSTKMDAAQIPKLQGTRGYCAVVQGGDDTLAMTINRSQGDKGFSVFYSPDFLSDQCDPIDQFNTGTFATGDLCVGSTKVNATPFDFVDKNGYRWQGDWCCTRYDSINDRRFCDNGAIPIAIVDEGYYYILVKDPKKVEDPQNACDGDVCSFDDYSLNFKDDSETQRIWTDFAKYPGCFDHMLTLQVLCARPYPQ